MSGAKYKPPSHTPGGHMPGSEADLEPVRETVLVTGFPGFLTRRMVVEILAEDGCARLFLLAPADLEDDARSFVAGLAGDAGQRIEIVLGDVAAMDMGLSGSEYTTLAGAVTAIHHMAGSEPTASDLSAARQLDVGGAREVIELAESCKGLRRLCYWSTAMVSGKRKGMILEDELDAGQSFFNVHERTRLEAEKAARAAQRRLPVTIFRPGMIVGDSVTGELDRLEGASYLMFLIATNAAQVSLPLPGRGTAPLNLVPVDYVIDAAHALSHHERAAGRTFHLTDPNPLSARRVYELVAESSGTPPPRGYIPGGITRALFRIPGIGRLARGPLSFLDAFDHQAFYNCRNAQELLAEAGIRCPPFDSYVESLVRYLREIKESRRRPDEDDDYDPLD